MKRSITLLLLLLSIQTFGQINPKDELKKIFYALPIDADIETIIDSAKRINEITPWEGDTPDTSMPDFSGHMSRNDYLSTEPESGLIEIFQSNDYTLFGTKVDLLDVMYVRFDFEDDKTKALTKEYKQIVKTFKRTTSKSKRYNIYSDKRELIGLGVRFYKIGNMKLPFMSIELRKNDCSCNSKALIISYYKTVKK